MYPPSDWLSRAVATTKRSASTPAATLELDFAHGFPGRDNLANTLHVSKHGDAVYYLASMGVVYDAKKHRQRFFRGHDDDVRCIAAHPDGITFATGQDGAKPCACVWTAGDECDPPMRGGWAGRGPDRVLAVDGRARVFPGGRVG